MQNGKRAPGAIELLDEDSIVSEVSAGDYRRRHELPDENLLEARTVSAASEEAVGNTAQLFKLFRR